MVSTGILAKNTTSNHTVPEEHHSYSEEKIKQFFKNYGDEKSIIASQLCNFTQKLSRCNAKASSDGHDHGSETSQEHLVEGTNEEKHHEEEDEEGHDEEDHHEEDHEEGHEEGHEGHEEEKVRAFSLYVQTLI